MELLGRNCCDLQTNACAKETKAEASRESQGSLWEQMHRMCIFCESSDSGSAGNVKDRRSQSSLKIEVDGCPLLYLESSKQKSREDLVEYYARQPVKTIREVLLFCSKALALQPHG